MDEWIRRMREIPGFCTECTESGRAWTDAADNARTAIGHARTAAHWLRNAAARLPEQAGSLNRAAAHYDGIVDLLHPALAAEGEASYRTFIGDIERQRAHADEVLVPVKAQYLQAAEAMDEALEAME
jgi:hypothetical protein